VTFPVIATALGLAGFAPTIAKWLSGGKAEEAATQVIDIAQKVTGTLNPMDAMERLRGDTEMVSAFQADIIQWEAKVELAAIEDRKDARARDTVLIQKGQRNLRADFMVAAPVTGLILCVVALAYFPITLHGEAVGLLTMVAGIFGNCLKEAYGFEFGSSRRGKEKEDSRKNDNIASLIDKYNHTAGKE
jgi:hypothetical protein